MEQHPIPQNISSYEFRLVGDMTLKQFFQLSGGIIVGLIIFRLPLFGIIKYPLVFIAVMTGVAMAFIPLNGRPFGRWITAFLRAIYSPTEFDWVAPTNQASASPAPQIISPTISPPPTNPTITSSIPTPSVPSTASSESTSSISFTPSSTPPPVSTAPDMLLTSQTTSPTPPTSTKDHFSPQNEAPAFIPTPPPPPPANLTSEPKEIFFAPNKAPAPLPNIPSSKPLAPSQPVTHTTQIAPPTQSNIITGLVTDSASNPLESAIVEIIDNGNGLPVRALRTNRLGQFQIATPLSPGKYTIQAEKDGFTFANTNFEANNQIISPIYIQANSA